MTSPIESALLSRAMLAEEIERLRQAHSVALGMTVHHERLAERQAVVTHLRRMMAEAAAHGAVDALRLAALTIEHGDHRK